MIARRPSPGADGTTATTTRAPRRTSPRAAVVLAARWAVNTRASLAAEEHDAPSLAPVLRGLAAVVADPTDVTRAALAGALRRWASLAVDCDPVDHRALTTFALGAVDAAELLSPIPTTTANH